MKNSEELKNLVKEKYSEIVNKSDEKGCCGSGCADGCSDFSDNYEKLEGYLPEADLGLGCGLPTQFAKIKEGNTVVDLGSGAGNDCFVARALTGETGKVIGIDITEAMILKAKANAAKLNYNNVEFRLGEIEDIPLASNRADVVISNCVLNLVPDKKKAFEEIFRILKPEGHFSISDIVLKGNLPSSIKKAAEMYAGCVSGAMQKDEYISVIEKTGFKDITLQKETKLSDEILLQYMNKEELKKFRESGSGIYSVTVYGLKSKSSCCAPESICCN